MLKTKLNQALNKKLKTNNCVDFSFRFEVYLNVCLMYVM